MDNQQASNAAAWIAGLWLADGYFGLSAADIKGQGFRRYYPRNVLVMKDKPVIEAVYQALRLNGIGAHISMRQIDPKWASIYTLQCHGWKRTESLIQFILPYLIGRKRVSALILLSIAHSSNGGAGAAFSEPERELREWAYKTLKWLNRRGVEASETTPLAPPEQVGEDIVQALREI